LDHIPARSLYVRPARRKVKGGVRASVSKWRGLIFAPLGPSVLALDPLSMGLRPAHLDTALVWSSAFTRPPGPRQPGPPKGGTPNGSRLAVALGAVSRRARLRLTSFLVIAKPIPVPV
jgi:hypothetical protein